MNIKFLKEGTESDVGDTIRIESTLTSTKPFDDAESKTTASNITITITGYNDNEVVSQAAMTENDTGEYYYKWDTTGLDSGDYEIVVEASKNGTTEKEDDWIRITD